MGCPVQLIREDFRDCIRRRRRHTFASLWGACLFVCPRRSYFKTFSEDCYSLFVNRLYFKSVLNLRKAYIFKSLLKVYYQSVFAEPFKTSMFQKFWRPLCHKVNLESCAARRRLCHKVNLPRCEARRRRFIMTYDIFATGQTNILGVGSMLFIRRKM